jgi:1,4-dihydroxy-2-naphthoate octaprenyltransferase
MSARDIDDGAGLQRVEQLRPGGLGESPIHWQDGVAGIPDALQRLDERRPAGKVDGDELRHIARLGDVWQGAGVAPADVPSLKTTNRWVVGARLRTLPAAVVPVALGAAAAVGQPHPVWWRAPLALVVSLALQVGVNYANDYSDGIRGTDEVRIGPQRMVGGGLAGARSVKRAAFSAFGVAAVTGLVLASVTSWWLLVVGVAAILAAWFYTGGPKPYGYLGLGEIFVFVFFGLVATIGTTFVVCEGVPALSWVVGCIAGSLACALLVVNNLRDIPTDRLTGKKTLAVRLGDPATRWFYVILVAGAFVLVAVAAVHRPRVLVGLLGLVVAWKPVTTVRRGASGRDLIAVLGGTGRVQMVVGLLTAAGIAISA